jgi:hypothetical protein
LTGYDTAVGHSTTSFVRPSTNASTGHFSREGRLTKRVEQTTRQETNVYLTVADGTVVPALPEQVAATGRPRVECSPFRLLTVGT